MRRWIGEAPLGFDAGLQIHHQPQIGRHGEHVGQPAGVAHEQLHVSILIISPQPPATDGLFSAGQKIAGGPAALPDLDMVLFVQGLRVLLPAPHLWKDAINGLAQHFHIRSEDGFARRGTGLDYRLILRVQLRLSAVFRPVFRLRGLAARRQQEVHGVQVLPDTDAQLSGRPHEVERPLPSS